MKKIIYLSIISIAICGCQKTDTSTYYCINALHDKIATLNRKIALLQDDVNHLKRYESDIIPKERMAEVFYDIEKDICKLNNSVSNIVSKEIQHSNDSEFREKVINHMAEIDKKLVDILNNVNQKLPAQKKITYPQRCNKCNGTGRIYKYETCDSCHGNVTVPFTSASYNCGYNRYYGSSFPSVQKTIMIRCRKCQWSAKSGQIKVEHKCDRCNGVGYIEK